MSSILFVARYGVFYALGAPYGMARKPKTASPVQAKVRSPPVEVPSRSPTHLRHWRKFKKLSQDDAAERIGVSQATLSKIERGELPYNQDFLESAALVYGAHEAADLLNIDPLRVDTINELFSQFRAAPAEVQKRAMAVIEALLKAS